MRRTSLAGRPCPAAPTANLPENQWTMPGLRDVLIEQAHVIVIDSSCGRPLENGTVHA